VSSAVLRSPTSNRDRRRRTIRLCCPLMVGRTVLHGGLGIATGILQKEQRSRQSAGGACSAPV
jgi:hypothetical protein